jgi:glycosyltransferase involved in cell wall biosynthesis
MVIEVLPAIRERHPDVLYVMVGGPRVGEKSYPASLRRRAAELGMEAHIRFAGPQPHVDLARWFNAADLFVLASRSEGCPNVLLESLACGLPIVATDVGGIPEVIRHGRDGLLAPYGDLAAIRDALLHALGRPWDREALVGRARHFDWSDAAEQAIEELNLALKEGR